MTRRQPPTPEQVAAARDRQKTLDGLAVQIARTLTAQKITALIAAAPTAEYRAVARLAQRLQKENRRQP